MRFYSYIPIFYLSPEINMDALTCQMNLDYLISFNRGSIPHLNMLIVIESKEEALVYSYIALTDYLH